MARTIITSSNLSPLVLIITWFLCIISSLSMLARGISKTIVMRSLKADDYTSVSSLLFNVAQSVAVTVQTSNGLGKHVNKLAASQLTTYSKATYAGNVLYFGSMSLSELSVLFFVGNITPVRSDRKMLVGVGSVVIAWSTIGFIVSAAECGSPTPWNYFGGHCINRIIWGNYVEVLSILINCALIALPIYVVSRLRISLSRKFSVGSMFALRITVCVASICKLVYLNRARPLDDLTFVLWPVTLCNQTVQCLSITTFSLLYLKPLLEALSTGFIRSDELRRKGQTNAEGSFSLSTLHPGKENKAVKKFAALTGSGNNKTTITALGNAAGWEGGSQSSEAQIIRETRTWAVASSSADEDRMSPQSYSRHSAA